MSCFYTPPFSALDRKRVFTTLGFSNLAFYFFEVSGGTVIRGRHVTAGGTRPLLQSTYYDSPSPGLPVLVRHRPTGKLVAESFRFNLTPWEALFPYPLNLLHGYFSGILPELEIRPAPFEGALRSLWETFQRLTPRLQETEVSLLWLKGERDELPILFHYVRTRLVRVGTADHLKDLGPRYRRGSLSPEDLRDRFGTSSAFYYLDRGERPSEGDPLLTLNQNLSELPGIISKNTSRTPAL